MAGDRKSTLRSELLAARKAVSREERAAESEQLCDHLRRLVDGVNIVCAYVPMGTEPGSPECLDELTRLSATVLLPVARTGPDGEHLPLHWGRYVPGELTNGPFGTREPGAPWLPASAVSTAGVVLVPALAVDRRGVRLGRGGGFYDRTLALCRPDAKLVAVVRDSEILDEVPGEPHDIPVTHALTPAGGLVPLSVMRIAQ